MDQSVLERIAGIVRSDLHLPEDQDATIKRYVGRAVTRIQAFCARDDLPVPLEDVAAQIAGDMLRFDQVAVTTNDVSSITRGDTSISYRDKTAALKETVDFFKDYESQLIQFKRIQLPEDRT